MNIYDLLGKSKMKVFDYLVDLDIDVTVSEIVEGTNISRKTVDMILLNLINNKIITIYRLVGKTKLYIINKENYVTKKLLEINKHILKEQEKKLLA